MAKKSQGAKAKRGTSSKPEGRKSAEDNESGAEPARGGSREGKGGKSRKEDKASKGSGKHLGGRGGDCGEDAQLHAAIEADGSRTIVKMADDGNCLFRSLSDQLYADWGNDHADVRSEVCDFLESHEDEYSGFLVLDDEDEPEAEDAKDFASYVAGMRRDGEWGGNLELVVAARLFRRNIVVFSANLAALTIEHDGGGKKKKNSSGPDLLLSYHDNQHYNSVRSNSSKPLPRKKPPPPPPRIKTSVRVAEDNETVEVAVEESHESGEDDDGSEEGRLPSDDFGESKDDESARSNSQLTAGATEDGTVGGDAPSAETIGSEELPPGAAPSAFRPDKRVTKNSSCPCGSGLRYKKCCWPKERHAVRVRALRGEKGGRNSSACSRSESNDGSLAPSSDSKRTESRDDDEPQELQGGFRVLKI